MSAKKQSSQSKTADVEVVRTKVIDGRIYVPNDDDAKMARTLSGLGIPVRMIAKQLRITYETLSKHYKDELEEGASKATTAVAKRLYDIIMHADDRTALAATCFWLKCRAGWRTTDTEQSITQLNIQNNVAAGNVRTDDEIEQFKARWETIGVEAQEVRDE